MGFMDRRGSVLWGQVLGLLSRIRLVGFCIFQWIKSCISCCLRPLYKKQSEVDENEWLKLHHPYP